MAFHFRRSVRVFPGVRLNFSTRGISTTIGGRGASVHIGPQGSFLNLGIPGTGLSTRTRLTSPAPSQPLGGANFGHAPAPASPPEPVSPRAPGAVPLPGEIRSAESDAITSVGLRQLRELLAEAYQESKRLRSELPAVKEQLQKTHTRAYRWQQGAVLKRLLRRKYATILQDFESARTEFRQLEEEIERCRIALEIQMERGMEDTYGVLVDAFRALAACDRCWDTTSEMGVDRVRERSSANRRVTRSLVIPECKPAEVIAPSRPALRFPNANGGDLYILPGLLLVFSGETNFALVNLTEVRLEYRLSRFQEEEGVPADSRVVGETWVKVNKDGSPDRRFSNNYRIPVVEYGVLRFQSAAGLNEEFMFSNAIKAERFRAAFAAHQGSVPLG